MRFSVPHRMPSLVAASALVALAACNGSTVTSTPSTAAAPATTDVSMPSSDDATESGGESNGFTFGEPAAVADADRTIEIDVRDLSFAPRDMEIERGETVAFVVTNLGSETHDFVLGDAAVHQRYADEWEQILEARILGVDDEPNAIVIPSGETRSMAWRFPDAVRLEYACHLPGHYEAGMRGSIDVS